MYGRPRSFLDPWGARGSPWKSCWMLCLGTRIPPSVPNISYGFLVDFLDSGNRAGWRNVPGALSKEKFCTPERCESGPVWGVPWSLPNAVLRHRRHRERLAAAETCAAWLLRAGHGLERALSSGTRQPLPSGALPNNLEAQSKRSAFALIYQLLSFINIY